MNNVIVISQQFKVNLFNLLRRYCKVSAGGSTVRLSVWYTPKKKKKNRGCSSKRRSGSVGRTELLFTEHRQRRRAHSEQRGGGQRVCVGSGAEGRWVTPVWTRARSASLTLTARLRPRDRWEMCACLCICPRARGQDYWWYKTISAPDKPSDKHDCTVRHCDFRLHVDIVVLPQAKMLRRNYVTMVPLSDVSQYGRAASAKHLFNNDIDKIIISDSVTLSLWLLNIEDIRWRM